MHKRLQRFGNVFVKRKTVLGHLTDTTERQQYRMVKYAPQNIIYYQMGLNNKNN